MRLTLHSQWFKNQAAGFKFWLEVLPLVEFEGNFVWFVFEIGLLVSFRSIDQYIKSIEFPEYWVKIKKLEETEEDVSLYKP